MQIILVYPEPKMWPIPSVGLLYVAALLEREGHTVEIFDCSQEYFQGRDALDAYRAFLQQRPGVQMVALGVTTPQFPLACDVAHLTKSLRPDVQLVLGGPHPTFLPEQTLAECPHADVVVRGEGELTMGELAAGRALESVAGLTYRSPGGLRSTPNRPPVRDLDTLPQPAWHLLDMEYYASPKAFDDFYNPGRRMACVITSRGCGGCCNFCAAWTMHGAKPRYHSIARVVQEIEYLVRTYGIDVINFQDDNMLADPARAKAFCEEMVRRGLHQQVQWFCHLTSVQVEPHTLDMLADAGCYQIGVGFESFANKTLADMHKSTSFERNLRTVEIIKQSRLRCLAYFMSGYLNETEDSIAQTQDMQRYCALDLPSWTHYIPFPGTRDYAKLEKEGRLGDQDWVTFDMSQSALSLVKRNYSAVPYQQYVRLYLSHIENYHFIRRCINGIELRKREFSRRTGLQIPVLGWTLPPLRDGMPPALERGLRRAHGGNLFQAHEALRECDPAALAEADRRAWLEALIFIHLQRVEDDLAQQRFDELKPLLKPEALLIALARGSISLGNYANAMRLLRRGLRRRPELFGVKARRLLAYVAMLMGRSEVVAEAWNQAPVSEDDQRNLAQWRALSGTAWEHGLPHVFKRYAAGDGADGEPFAGEFERLLAPHRYRFLSYYLPLRERLRKAGVRQVLLWGFDRWSRQALAHLQATEDFALSGLADELLCRTIPVWEGVPVRSCAQALQEIGPGSAVVIADDVRGRKSKEALRQQVPGTLVCRLFTEDADLSVLPSLTREIHGFPIHRFA